MLVITTGKNSLSLGRPKPIKKDVRTLLVWSARTADHRGFTGGRTIDISGVKL